jgi:predicted Zn-dependent protease
MRPNGGQHTMRDQLHLRTAGFILSALCASGCGDASPGDSCSPDQFVPNYAQLVAPLAHWPMLPVRVRFPESGGFSDAVRATAEAAYREWVDATDGALAIETVAPAEDADIDVEFLEVAHIGAADPRDTVAAVTSSRVDGHRMKSVTIRLALENRSSIKLQEVAAHEFGHALGIVGGPNQGHSDDTADLMFPADTVAPNVNKPISEADVNTIKTAYCDLF